MLCVGPDSYSVLCHVRDRELALPVPCTFDTAAVVNALAKPGVDLGENGSVIPKPKGKPS